MYSSSQVWALNMDRNLPVFYFMGHCEILHDQNFSQTSCSVKVPYMLYHIPARSVQTLNNHLKLLCQTLAERDTCWTDQKHFPHMPDALLCFLKGATCSQAQMQMSTESLWNLSAHQSETKCLGLWLKMWWRWEAAVTFQRRRRRTRHQMLTGGVRLLLSVQKEKLWGHLSWSDTTLLYTLDCWNLYL